MKSDGFIKLLRKVIREEVQAAIKAELRPLLNETANAPATQEMLDYSTTNFSSAMGEAIGSPQHVSRPLMPLVTNDINGVPVNMQNENVAKTVDLMTKDYSALMKAIDKKKNR